VKTPATVTGKFGYEGTEYAIDLCDRHGRQFDQDLIGWVRLAEEITDRWGITVVERPLPEIRNGHKTEPEPVESVDPLTEAAQRVEAPLDSAFEFSWHAIEQMAMRQIPRDDVLRVLAAKGKVRRPGTDPGTFVYQHRGIAVVVNEEDKVIITVAWQPEMVEIHGKKN
jgi:hypothetical protein